MPHENETPPASPDPTAPPSTPADTPTPPTTTAPSSVESKLDAISGTLADMAGALGQHLDAHKVSGGGKRESRQATVESSATPGAGTGQAGDNSPAARGSSTATPVEPERPPQPQHRWWRPLGRDAKRGG